MELIEIENSAILYTLGIKHRPFFVNVKLPCKTSGSHGEQFFREEK